MSSTNKTPNYNLSQYVGTDKPTYLGDYNGDMLKIDTQMKANNDAATVAAASAGEAVAKATAAQNDVDALKTRMSNVEQDITQAESNITQLQNTVTAQGQMLNTTTSTANQAKTAADAAKASVDTNSWTPETTATNISSGLVTGDLTCTYNPFLKLLNIRGELSLTNLLNQNTPIFKLPSTIPTPTAARTINSFGYIRTSANDFGGGAEVSIETDGRIIYRGGGVPGNSKLYVQQMLQTSAWFN